MKEKILVIASHPDDETLGCGATIARHVHEGADVGIITLTNGVSSRDNELKIDAKKRNTAAKKAINLLGARWIEDGKWYKDNIWGSVEDYGDVHLDIKAQEKYKT